MRTGRVWPTIVKGISRPQAILWIAPFTAAPQPPLMCGTKCAARAKAKSKGKSKSKAAPAFFCRKPAWWMWMCKTACSRCRVGLLSLLALLAVATVVGGWCCSKGLGVAGNVCAARAKQQPKQRASARERQRPPSLCWRPACSRGCQVDLSSLLCLLVVAVAGGWCGREVVLLRYRIVSWTTWVNTGNPEVLPSY